MKKGFTELVFILDRSGSMAGLESDTVGGFNAMLKKQQEEPGECKVTTVLFDDRYELLHDRIDLQGVRPITERDYYVRGCTALLDAVGRTIGKLVNVQRNTAESERAEHVMFVITTDGMENASREYTAERVRELISRQREKYGWEFLFLGANMDAVETATRYGFTRDRIANYCPDSAGTQENFTAMNNAATCLRRSSPLNADWKDGVDADFARRGRKNS